LEVELKLFPEGKRDAARRKRIEAWANAGHGSCILREPHIAGIVQSAFLLFDGNRYRLIAWVVMPNHVHVLIQPIAPWTVARIVASWKTFTGRKFCKIGAVSSALVWHREYWDRYIRNQEHLAQAIEYIHKNPVKAGLVKKAERWPWSSAFVGKPPAK
jgi:putative transposase